MKFKNLFAILILLTLILTPAAALRFSSADSDQQISTTQPDTTKTQPATETTTAQKKPEGHVVKLLRMGSGQVEEIPLEDYVVGALAAEMPAGWHAQALRAQAVACRTNAIYNRERPNAALNGADLSDYTGSHQGYLDEQQRIEKWGDTFEINEEICRAAAADTAGKTMKYKGKTAFAAFHTVSSGTTESAKSVWGNDLAYLRPVPSPGDELAPNFEKQVVVPLEGFHTELVKQGSEIKDDKIKIGKTVLTDSGYVAEITLGGQKIKGTKVREIFALPSAAFTLTVTQDSAVFDCRGLGHGVGLSQFGAKTLAEQGKTWQEILGHYYAGTELD
ncbi:MAG: stage II sporulation protein D [Oscillospiraceae bacterium]|nr:stage II sporulation protein D [Oscillospiraceae bacterium]